MTKMLFSELSLDGVLVFLGGRTVTDNDNSTCVALYNSACHSFIQVNPISFDYVWKKHIVII